MKNIELIGLSILSIFIICSLSYQPIIADGLIDSITNIDDVKISDDDCDCKNNNRPFLICLILSLLIVPLEYFLVFFVIPNELLLIEDIIEIPLEILDELYFGFRCFRPF